MRSPSDAIKIEPVLPQTLAGLDVLRRLRTESRVPVLILTARGDDVDRIVGLEIGADDYITKPFSSPELLARLRAAQRKTRPSEEVSVFKNGDLVVDLTAHVVTRAGREIKLSATEYALLRLFVKHPGRVLTHRHILREIWGPKSEEHRQYLRVYVTHLRQKIEPDPAKPAGPALLLHRAGAGAARHRAGRPRRLSAVQRPHREALAEDLRRDALAQPSLRARRVGGSVRWGSFGGLLLGHRAGRRSGGALRLLDQAQAIVATLLRLEDDETLRDYAVDSLTEMGYRVFAAAQGAAVVTGGLWCRR